MAHKVAIILFPGTNCEQEALRACQKAGLEAEFIRWNEDKKKVQKYDAYLLPGGFSYEDRGRSGIVAAKQPIVETVVKEGLKGKPVLGICNGAQILVEAGLIPGLKPGNLEMGLSYNERVKNGKIVGKGFYNDWVYVKADAPKGRSVFNRFSRDMIMRIPVAHCEGRFTTNKNVLKRLQKNKQTLFRYCDENGKFINEFPVNPNGAMYNLAGVCNEEGNIMSLMPHPERTEFIAIFHSLADFLSSNKKVSVKKTSPDKTTSDHPLKKRKKSDIEILVDLVITDNTERTIENTIKRMGFKKLTLKRKTYFAIDINDKRKAKSIAEKILRSGEILNLNKEIPTININGSSFSFSLEKGLTSKKTKESTYPQFAVTEVDNYSGESANAKLKPYFKGKDIKKIEKGVIWEIHSRKENEVNKVIKTNIFHNPNSLTLTKA